MGSLHCMFTIQIFTRMDLIQNLENTEYSDEEGDDDDDEDNEPKRKVKGIATRTKKAAAAMCVGMGSFSDPFEAQGLAHILEHMLFMGSTEFPDENEYDSYLSKHGGSSNAYTETEHTCYHFDVKREFLKDALERFSLFFVSPLVKNEAMERESLTRFCKVMLVAFNNFNATHLYLVILLTDFFGSLVDAMEKGINLWEQILKLHRDYYHGGLMKLVVIGGDISSTCQRRKQRSLKAFRRLML